MDHLGRKYAILPSFLIQALGMFLLPFTHSFGTLLAAAMLIALGNGIGSGSMMTIGADLAPKESRGEFLGLWRLIGDVGNAGGPIVVGQVADLLTLPMAALGTRRRRAVRGAGLWPAGARDPPPRAQGGQITTNAEDDTNPHSAAATVRGTLLIRCHVGGQGPGEILHSLDLILPYTRAGTQASLTGFS